MSDTEKEASVVETPSTSDEIVKTEEAPTPDVVEEDTVVIDTTEPTPEDTTTTVVEDPPTETDTPETESKIVDPKVVDDASSPPTPKTEFEPVDDAIPTAATEEDSIESVDDEILEDELSTPAKGLALKDSANYIDSPISGSPPKMEMEMEVDTPAEPPKGITKSESRTSMVIEEMGLQKVKFDVGQLDAANFQEVGQATVRHTFGQKLGLSVQDARRNSFLPGVVVTHITPGSPASQAVEISVGDLIVAINDNSLVGLKMNDKLKMLRATAKSHPTHPTTKLSYIKCQKIFEHILSIEYGNSHGVVMCDEKHIKGNQIFAVETGSPAAMAGIPSSHYILSVNEISVAHVSVDKCRQLLSQQCSTGKLAIVTMPAFIYEAQLIGKAKTDDFKQAAIQFMGQLDKTGQQMMARYRAVSIASASRNEARAKAKANAANTQSTPTSTTSTTVTTSTTSTNSTPSSPNPPTPQKNTN
eukprot:m.209503 g.209503  ORF g.209503 m.209503 type:complete len:473 (-) comp33040_c0_seq1:78-1496(-)